MLSSIDIAVSVVLAERPRAKFEDISDILGISVSKAFGAVERLMQAGLMVPEGRRVDRLALLEFLEHGIRYVFPAEPGHMKKGVPTAHSSPILAREIDSDGDAYVWPSPNGSVRGREIEPLVPKASELPQRSPQTYEALSLVDALRVGRARERKLAGDALRKRFHVGAAGLAL
jgi:DNA-binding Lrp family transcriptional regulator